MGGFRYRRNRNPVPRVKAPTAVAPTAIPVMSVGIFKPVVVLTGFGLELGYGIIMKKGEDDAVAEPLVGHGVIRKRGVLVGVMSAVGVEDG